MGRDIRSHIHSVAEHPPDVQSVGRFFQLLKKRFASEKLLRSHLARAFLDDRPNRRYEALHTCTLFRRVFLVPLTPSNRPAGWTCVHYVQELSSRYLIQE